VHKKSSSRSEQLTASTSAAPNLLGPQLSSIITMTKSPVVTQAPSEQVTVGDYCCTVRTAACYVTDTLGAQSFNETRFLTVTDNPHNRTDL